MSKARMGRNCQRQQISPHVVLDFTVAETKWVETAGIAQCHHMLHSQRFTTFASRWKYLRHISTTWVYYGQHIGPRISIFETEQQRRRESRSESMMGHISKKGSNSQFNQVWGAESLQNDFRDNNSSSSSQESPSYGSSTGDQSTSSWSAPGLFGQNNFSNLGSDSNRSTFGSLSSGGQQQQQQNTVENIWGQL